jgi:hypothetical protein
VTTLPESLRDRPRDHLRGVKQLHERDTAAGYGRVPLPYALDRKYPNAAAEWPWQFVFPASRVCRDAKWGPPGGFTCGPEPGVVMTRYRGGRWTRQV